MSHATYDAIVLGVGGMGSAAVFELAWRGRKVLGLEQFPLVHSRGSSHGQTRIIRTAYAEHPGYVPLVQRAFSRWYELEQRTGWHLLTECPCLNVGCPGSEHLEGVRASARQHRLSVTEMPSDQITHTFPAFRFPTAYSGILEVNAGFLYVEECVRAHIDAARELGAEVRGEETVREWKAVGGGVEVRTDNETYRAARLIITAGAWSSRLMADLNVPLTVMRQVLAWFDVGDRAAMFRRNAFPVFIAEVPGGAWYGLPAIDRFGLKIARHYGALSLKGPEEVEWDTTGADEDPLRGFLDSYVAVPVGPMTKAAVCMYTLTPDRHFVIDLHPAFPQVAFAAGFSGHGFKFASVVGEILADLVEMGRTRHGIGMFSVKRFL